MLELQPPPFPLETLQSPVTDMPGFDWCSNLDWNENASYENPITPSLPYSAYHTHTSVVSSECTNGSGTNAALGPIPPLELISPLQSQEEKFAIGRRMHMGFLEWTAAVIWQSFKTKCAQRDKAQ